MTTKAGYLCCFLYFTTVFLVTGVNLLIQGSYGGICLNECGRHGGSYSYCETTANWWDYCSNVEEVSSYTYGQVCKTNHPCGFHGYKYLWCYTDDSWGYCSLYPNEADIAEDGKACRKDFPCEKHGEGYYWCYTDGANNWHYCKDSDKRTDTTHLTRYGYHCLDACETRNGYSYNTCSYSFHSWIVFRTTSDYCSSNPDFTYRGDACTSGHPCDKYKEEYYWCYKQKGSWNYCSPVNNCGYWPTSSEHRVKRLVPDNTVCTISTAIHTVVVLMAIANQRDGRLSQSVTEKQTHQIHHSIAKWDRTSIDKGIRAGTLFETNEFRIDLQGTFSGQNGNTIANIQVQSNGDNSQSYAGIHVPVGETFSNRHFRRALTESLRLKQIINMNRTRRAP